MNEHLISEAEELRLGGHALQLLQQEDGWTFAVFENYPLPEGFNHQTTKLLIKVPPNYPLGGLDMFWTNPQVLLSSGVLPANTSVEHYLDTPWLRFSWHPNRWNPSSDSLTSYLKFINMRLEQRI